MSGTKNVSRCLGLVACLVQRLVLSLKTRQVQDFIFGLVLGSVSGIVSSLVSSVVSILIPSVAV